MDPPVIDKQTGDNLTALAAARKPSTVTYPPSPIALTRSHERRDHGRDVRQFSADRPFPGTRENAWKLLSASVEAEVFAAVGAPSKIKILGPTRRERAGKNEKAHYDSQTTIIHIGAEHASPGPIAHEVGHHIEQQGAVEIWYAPASYLQRFSAGRPLNSPVLESSCNITYGVEGNIPRLVPSGSTAFPIFRRRPRAACRRPETR